MKARLYIIILIIVILLALQIALDRASHAGYMDNNVVDNTINKTVDSLKFRNDNYLEEKTIR